MARSAFSRLHWWLAIMAVAAPGTTSAAPPATVEYLSDARGAMINSARQGWGELGLDVCAHLPEQTALKLRIGDREYTRGLGMHANGEVVLPLDGAFASFEAEVGVQWINGHSRGSVVFTVSVDGRPAFDSGSMRESDPPRAVTVNVQGADELRLVVTDAGDGISDDCADWVDARLVRSATPPPAAAAPVDIAPFAEVRSWDPRAMEGTKASRSDEFPAADVRPFTTVTPNHDGTFSAPFEDDTACIGLEWPEERLLRRVAIRFAEAGAVRPAASVQLQYWIGASAWQGQWQPAPAVPVQEGRELNWSLTFQDLPRGTMKVRWLFTGAAQPAHLQRMSAFTRSRWKTVPVRIVSAGPVDAQPAHIDLYNGVIADNEGSAAYSVDWDGRTPLALSVRAAVAVPYKADRTVLRFRFPDTAFGVAVEDLLTNPCVYVPHAGLFVTRDPPPVTPEAYLQQIAPRQTMLEEVRARPDQELRRAVAELHTPRQDTLPYANTLLSLACDNRKFIVERSGAVVFNTFHAPDDYPGASDGVHTVAANVNQWRLAPRFAGQELPIARRLRGGWLPMVENTARGGAVEYRQLTYVAPVGEAAVGQPVWLRERALGVLEFEVQNTGSDPAEATLALRLVPEQAPQPALRVEQHDDAILVIDHDRLLAAVGLLNGGLAPRQVDTAGITLAGQLAPQAVARCAVYLPAWNAAPADYTASFQGQLWAQRTENYWNAVLAPAMQVDVPDELLGNLIRASQVHCLLAARNEHRGQYIVPWISSIHFAYPESEANSIIRGMSLFGHVDFANRALEFYLSKANAAGYITIIVANICGYTLVGTGEIMWTLGEHFQRTRDRAWMSKVAPDVARVCRWIMRQRAKTRLQLPGGGVAPEYGLFPPGVSADWNRFAYRFFNDAQYYRGLYNAGQALSAIGNAAGDEILEDARDYRADIVRAYHTLQAGMPVVPLRDGTWVPGAPSILGCFGNVEDFLPDVDAAPNYAYSVELGANHLVANEVLDPAGRDADWMMDYLEDVHFLRSRYLDGPEKKDPFTLGGFAKMQPYYCRSAEIHALRDDVKPFIRAYFNPIGALVNLENLSFWEDWNGGQTGGAWNKTHETGWFLAQTRTMLVTERGDDLWLAPFIPNQWLQSGRHVAIANAPTRFGTVGYQISSAVAEGHIDAEVRLPPGCTARRVVLRLRHPEGRRMQAVTLQGQAYADFDPVKETITFAPSTDSVAVRAEY